MADTSESEGRAGGIPRKLLIPVAISAVGSLLGYLLSRRERLQEAAPKLRETVSDLPVQETAGRAGELTNELRGKIDKVLGKEPEGDLASGIPTEEDLSEFEERRRERQKRRDQRRQRPRS